MNAPPTRGPTTEATAKVAESELVMAGRTRGRDDKEMMMKHPEKTPAQPAPVTARPAIKVPLLGASALDPWLSIVFDIVMGRQGSGMLTTNQATDFEYENSKDKDGLDREILVRLPPS